MCPGCGTLSQAFLPATLLFVLYFELGTFSSSLYYIMEQWACRISTAKTDSQTLLAESALIANEVPENLQRRPLELAFNTGEKRTQATRVCGQVASSTRPPWQISADLSPLYTRLRRRRAANTGQSRYLGARYGVPRQSFRRLSSAVQMFSGAVGVAIDPRATTPSPQSRSAHPKPYASTVVPPPAFSTGHMPAEGNADRYFYPSLLGHKPQTREREIYQLDSRVVHPDPANILFHISSLRQNATGAPLYLEAPGSDDTVSSMRAHKAKREHSTPSVHHNLLSLSTETSRDVVFDRSDSTATEWPSGHTYFDAAQESANEVDTLVSSPSPLSSSLENAIDVDDVPWDSSFLRPGDDIFYPGQYRTPALPLYTNSTALLSRRQQLHRSGDGTASDLGVAQIVNDTLSALATYYQRLGDISTMLEFVGNITPALNKTAGVNTITDYFQATMNPQMRDRIVAMTPPYLFGRVQNLFWSTALAGWNAWVDSWTNFLQNPPFPVGVQLQKIQESIFFFNQLTDWLYWTPLVLTDTVQNATTAYAEVILAAKEQMYKRRDQVLLALIEKQVLFYAPVFHAAIAATQVGALEGPTTHNNAETQRQKYLHTYLYGYITHIIFVN